MANGSRLLRTTQESMFCRIIFHPKNTLVCVHVDCLQPNNACVSPCVLVSLEACKYMQAGTCDYVSQWWTTSVLISETQDTDFFSFLKTGPFPGLELVGNARLTRQ